MLLLGPCGRPANIPHAEFHGLNFDHKGKLRYSCKKGYKLRGPNRRTCHEDGKWSKPPSCSRKLISYLLTLVREGWRGNKSPFVTLRKRQYGASGRNRSMNQVKTKLISKAQVQRVHQTLICVQTSISSRRYYNKIIYLRATNVFHAWDVFVLCFYISSLKADIFFMITILVAFSHY